MNKAALISFLLFAFVAVRAQTTDNTFVVKKSPEAVDSLKLFGLYTSDVIELNGKSGFMLYLKLDVAGSYQLFIGGADKAITSAYKSSQISHAGVYKVENDTLTFAYRTEVENDFTILNRDFIIPKGTLVICTAAVHPDRSITLTREATVNSRPKVVTSVTMRKREG